MTTTTTSMVLSMAAIYKIHHVYNILHSKRLLILMYNVLNNESSYVANYYREHKELNHTVANYYREHKELNHTVANYYREHKELNITFGLCLLVVLDGFDFLSLSIHINNQARGQ